MCLNSTMKDNSLRATNEIVWQLRKNFFAVLRFCDSLKIAKGDSRMVKRNHKH